MRLQLPLGYEMGFWHRVCQDLATVSEQPDLGAIRDERRTLDLRDLEGDDATVRHSKFFRGLSSASYVDPCTIFPFMASGIRVHESERELSSGGCCLSFGDVHFPAHLS